MKSFSIIESYKKGYFSTTGGHKLYFELYGNPKGKPAVFLHGGPGAGFEDKYKGYFDPKVWNILFFDQRGAGRSTPFASTKDNTTQDLVEDIKKLTEHVGMAKFFLTGGSWGSTLALCYTIAYPKTVTGLLLRGIYLADKPADAHYLGGGVANFFPEAWERFIALVPKNERTYPKPQLYYYQQMQSKDPKVKEKYTFEWSFYECSILKLKTNEQEVIKDLNSFSYQSMSQLEAYYISNHCFIPEGYILKNAHKLRTIPTSIVHGRYDFVCTPKSAWELHRRLPTSRLFFTTAGHSGSEKENQKRLIAEIKRFSKANN